MIKINTIVNRHKKVILAYTKTINNKYLIHTLHTSLLIFESNPNSRRIEPNTRTTHLITLYISLSHQKNPNVYDYIEELRINEGFSMRDEVNQIQERPIQSPYTYHVVVE